MHYMSTEEMVKFLFTVMENIHQNKIFCRNIEIEQERDAYLYVENDGWDWNCIEE